MIPLVLTRTRDAVLARTRHPASPPRGTGGAHERRRAAPLKDLGVIPVCGSVRPLASQRQRSLPPR
jgi:hypothetical protein